MEKQILPLLPQAADPITQDFWRRSLEHSMRGSVKRDRELAYQIEQAKTETSLLYSVMDVADLTGMPVAPGMVYFVQNAGGFYYYNHTTLAFELAQASALSLGGNDGDVLVRDTLEPLGIRWSPISSAVTSDITITKEKPKLSFVEVGAAANNTRYSLYADNEQFRIDLESDDLSSAASIVAVNRTGNTIDDLVLKATAITMDGSIVALNRARLRSGAAGTAGAFLDDSAGAARAFVGLYDDDATPVLGILVNGDWRQFIDANGDTRFTGSLEVDGNFKLDGNYGSWTNVTFETGWTNLGGGYQACQYRKVGDMIQLRGTATRSSGSSATILTLPADARPPAAIIADTMANGALGRVDISTGGVFTLISGSANWVSLDSIVPFSVMA